MFVKLDNIFAPDAHDGPKSSEECGSSKPTLAARTNGILPQAGENCADSERVIPRGKGYKKHGIVLSCLYVCVPSSTTCRGTTST
jgi:hypothetical protein